MILYLTHLSRAGYEIEKDFSRIDGIYGDVALERQEVRKQLVHGVYEMVKMDTRAQHEDHNKGSIGCYLAHMKTWHHVSIHCSTEYALILEDDCAIPSDLKKRLIKVLDIGEKGIPNDWDILILGNRNLWSASTKIKSKSFQSDYDVIKPTFYTGMGAYLIKRDNISTIMKYMFPIRYQFDWQIAHQRDHIKYYAFVPFVLDLSPLFVESYVNHTKPVGTKRMKALLKEKYPLGKYIFNPFSE